MTAILDSNPVTRILFVDDEPHLLDGLRRALHGMRAEWEMSFVSSGAQALDLMRTALPHVVVSDMRMPGMNGRELLTEVKRLYPQTIRFVLSGYADAASVMQIVGTAHQFLSKPCDSSAIKEALARAVSTRKLLTSQSLAQRIGRVGSLPSLPKTFQEVMACLQGPEPSVTEVARIINADLAMTTVLLKVANSAFFGARQTFKTVDRAILFLGLQIITGLVLVHGLFRQTSSQGKPALDVDKLWNHSLQVAAGARLLARSENWSTERTEEAYLSGVVHDLGRLILAPEVPRGAPVDADALQVDMHTDPDHVHAAAGAYLLSLWGFGDELVEAIACHHAPLGAVTTDLGLAGIVHVADALAHQTDSRDVSANDVNFQEGYLEHLGMLGRIPKWQEIWRNGGG